MVQVTETELLVSILLLMTPLEPKLRVVAVTLQLVLYRSEVVNGTLVALVKPIAAQVPTVE